MMRMMQNRGNEGVFRPPVIQVPAELQDLSYKSLFGRADNALKVFIEIGIPLETLYKISNRFNTRQKLEILRLFNA